MNKRKFFKSLLACAAITFAEPLSLLKTNPKWIPNPDWVDAEYKYVYWKASDACGTLEKSYVIPIIFKRKVEP